jgi:hypothetical protein
MKTLDYALVSRDDQMEMKLNVPVRPITPSLGGEKQKKIKKRKKKSSVGFGDVMDG